VTSPTATVVGRVSSIARGASLSGIVHWTATPPAGTKSVEFWLDGARLQTLTAAPYTLKLDTTKYADGAHVVGIAWTDSTGIRHPASRASDVTIHNAIQSSIKAGDVLSSIVRWAATPPVSVRSVEFWVDNIRVATDLAAPYLDKLDTRRYKNGAHIVGVAWTDTAGTRHATAPLAVKIANSPAHVSVAQ
jgi:hypothetical protein